MGYKQPVEPSELEGDRGGSVDFPWLVDLWTSKGGGGGGGCQRDREMCGIKKKYYNYLPLSGELRITTLHVVWSPPAQRPSIRAG